MGCGAGVSFRESRSAEVGTGLNPAAFLSRFTARRVLRR